MKLIPQCHKTSYIYTIYVCNQSIGTGHVKALETLILKNKSNGILISNFKEYKEFLMNTWLQGTKPSVHLDNNSSKIIAQ